MYAKGVFAMKILVISGSPHKSGSTALLTENFIAGAEEAGHQVDCFEASFKSIHPCMACERCHKTGDGCVFKDDMEELRPLVLGADAVVFVTPVYYFGMNAQLAAAVNRFYAFNDKLLEQDKKAAFITAFADDEEDSCTGCVNTYQLMLRYFGWENKGIVAAQGCGCAEDVMKSSYPAQAYRLGKSF